MGLLWSSNWQMPSALFRQCYKSASSYWFRPFMCLEVIILLYTIQLAAYISAYIVSSNTEVPVPVITRINIRFYSPWHNRLGLCMWLSDNRWNDPDTRKILASFSSYFCCTYSAHGCTRSLKFPITGICLKCKWISELKLDRSWYVCKQHTDQ